MTKLKKKINSTEGETLVESLAAMMIVVMAMTMLASSILITARMNRKAKRADTEFQKVVITSEGRADNLTKMPGRQKVRVKHKKTGLSSQQDVEVDEYMTRDKNKYVFYEPVSGE